MTPEAYSEGLDLPAQVLAESAHVELPTRPDWIEPAVEFLKQKAILSGALRETRAGKVMLALHEALANAMVHGNLELSSELKEKGDDSFAQALAERTGDPLLAGRSVDVRIEYDGRSCRWLITDQGKGFNVERVLQRGQSDDPEEVLASGRGILIMRSFMDGVAYEAGGRRVILTLHRASGEEKRRQERLPLQEPVRVIPVGPDGTIDWNAAYQALARDFSAGGIGLLQEHLAHASRVIVELVHNNQKIYIPAEVRHCQALGGDMVELGCKFQTQPEPPLAGALPDTNLVEVQRAIDELVAQHGQPVSVSQERRQHSRVAHHQRIELHVPGQAEPVIGFTRDLSKSGVSFIVTRPLAGEAILSFPSRAGGFKVKAVVVRCNKIEEGFYDVGVRFLFLEKP